MLSLTVSHDSSRDFRSVYRDFFLQCLFCVQRDMETTTEWFCDPYILGYDEACINLRAENSNVWFYLLSADCALVSHARTRSFYVLHALHILARFYAIPFFFTNPSGILIFFKHTFLTLFF